MVTAAMISSHTFFFSKHMFSKPIFFHWGVILWNPILHIQGKNMNKTMAENHRYPPPREKITKIIRPEYFYVILGGADTVKLRNYQESISPRIILRNWQLQRPQTLPCRVTRDLRNSRENNSQRILLRN